MDPQSLIEQVWKRANMIRGYDGSVWRTDAFGSPILWTDYGNKESRYGWVLRRLRSERPEGERAATDYDAVQWQNT